MRLTLPSVDHLLEQARSVVLRFPIALVIAIAGTVAAVALVGARAGMWFEIPSYALGRWIVAALFGVPLAVSAVLLGESRGYARARILALEVFAAIITVFFYAFVLSSKRYWGSWETYRATAFVYAACTALLWTPFLTVRTSEHIWRYTATLVRRVCLVGIFTAALYIGIVLILQALHFLFNVTIPNDLYMQTWVVVVGVVAVWAFLAGIPRDLRALVYGDFSKTLRAFVQYIAFPVIVVYGAILYAYAAKILFTWNLPEGGVVWLVFGYSVAGFVTSLFLLPLLEKIEHRWASRVVRGFALSLFPLLVLYAVAIGVRVAEYGVTEDRYFVMVGGILLLAGTVYVFVTQMRQVVWVPVVLACALVLGVIGPWSAFATSERSQVARLERILTQHRILVDGKIRDEGVEKEVPAPIEQQVGSMVRYLTRANGAQAIRGWFVKPWSVTEGGMGAYDILRLIGVASEPTRIVDTDVVQLSAIRERAFSTQGFDYVFTEGSSSEQSRTADAFAVEIRANAAVVWRSGVQVARFDLRQMVTAFLDRYHTSPRKWTTDQASYDMEDAGYRLRLRMHAANVRRSTQTMEYFLGDVLLDVP
ncbi:MAG: DUF4153 domain-containing protein [Candidatus Uhrbacteria bacterium]